MRVLIDGQTLGTHEAQRGIGVVMRHLTEYLAAHDSTIEWLLTTPDGEAPRGFKASALRNIATVSVGLPSAADSRPHETYSRTLKNLCDERGVDVYWTPNPLMPNVLLPTELHGPAIAATIYDLIPWAMRETYLDRWPAHVREEYLRRLTALPKWADHLLFISASAREDYLRFDPGVADCSSVAHLAVDLARFQPRRAPAAGSRSPYVLLMGGFDARKNMDGALDAFAALVRSAPNEYANLKFVVACAYTPESRAEYEAHAARIGVADRLEMTGFVPDEALPELYRGAAAFFFPSRYEGFGLPVLEALACGLPVVTTRVSSIPEVAGELAFYCSPDDPHDMARALAEALSAQHDMSLKQRAVEHARTFHWAATAGKYNRVFRRIHGERRATIRSLGGGRPRVAYASPWPPQRSGIADNSLGLVAELRHDADLTLFLPQPETAHTTYGLPVRPIAELMDAYEEFDSTVYHMGNNSQMHTEIYRVAWQRPGVVVLHDYNIHPFLQHAFLKTPEEHLFYDSWLASHGKQPHEYDSGRTNVFEYPMCQALLKRSLAAIVHSRWAGQQLREAKVENVNVLPLCAVLDTPLSTPEQHAALRERLGLNPNKFVISTMGFVNRLKRLPSVLAAVRGLVDRGYPVELVIGGASLDPEMRVEERIAQFKLQDHVKQTGYLEECEFDALVHLSDVIVNLRCPSMGESSGTLIWAFGRGKACIVSNYQQFADLPDDVCWKADVDESEGTQLVAMLEHLLRHPETRDQLGRNGQRWVRQYATYAVAAKGYMQVIDAAIASQRRGENMPSRRAA
jgi:glycosyltransferase involved in cell wall biosynthesis